MMTIFVNILVITAIVLLFKLLIKIASVLKALNQMRNSGSSLFFIGYTIMFIIIMVLISVGMCVLISNNNLLDTLCG